MTRSRASGILAFLAGLSHSLLSLSLFLSSLARFLIFSLSFYLDTALASVTNICAAADAIMFADAGLELFFFVSSQH